MKIHFISIGGSIMHQLAIALHRKGYEVSGSDDEIFEPAKSNLQKEGILPTEMGWHPERITADLDAVILGMHARKENPELQKAESLGLKIYSFPEYIYEESKNKTRVVVGGSHGKTTTTSMIMHVLKENQQAFDYMVGAKLAGFDQSVNITNAPTIVCEGDEYLASALKPVPKFHFLKPNIAVLTGIAWDHINVFPTFDIYLEQFRIFINKIEAGGTLIYNATDSTLKEVVEASTRTDIRFQPYDVPTHRIIDGVTFVTIDGIEQQLSVFGDHNLLNMHAAYLACKDLGISTADFLKTIASFTGASKRLELMSKNDNLNVYRDFAHAPSKVKATIDAVKHQFPQRKLYAVLELHTYSSLNEDFMQQYKGAMAQADVAVVFYSKHALTLKQMPDLHPDVIKKGFDENNLTVLNTKDALETWLHSNDYHNSVLLLMSSGNYDGIDLVTFAQSITKK